MQKVAFEKKVMKVPQDVVEQETKGSDKKELKGIPTQATRVELVSENRAHISLRQVNCKKDNGYYWKNPEDQFQGDNRMHSIVVHAKRLEKDQKQINEQRTIQCKCNAELFGLVKRHFLKKHIS
jgi:hypothetical protein